MFCKKCGKQLKDGAQFCAYCGEKTGIPGASVRTEEKTGGKAGIPGAPVWTEEKMDVREELQRNVPVPEDEEEETSGRPFFLYLLLVLIILAVAAAAGYVLWTGVLKEALEQEEPPSSPEEDPWSGTEEEPEVPKEEPEEEEPAAPAVQEPEEETEEIPPEEPEERSEEGVHTYELLVGDVTWTQAFEDCIVRGGHLVRINSEEEYQAILQQIRQEEKDNIKFWLGGRRDEDSREYRWVYEDGSYGDAVLNGSDPYSAYWLSGEPSYEDASVGSQEMYMNMFYRKKEDRWVWNDVPDDLLAVVSTYAGTVGYICEYEE